MKKAGDILAAILDETSMKKAREYGYLFSSALWAELLENCGLERGFSHSRITELERSVLLIEADHPGWIQIFQTKQKELLNVIKRRFPELSLTGISFRLSRTIISPEDAPGKVSPVSGGAENANGVENSSEVKQGPIEDADKAAGADQTAAGDEALYAIRDENLRNTLQRLGQRIRERAAGNPSKPGYV